MTAFAEPGGEKGDSAFCSIHTVLSETRDGAWYLREQLEDGSWAYRCDDLTRLWALGNYRCAIVFADQWKDHERFADNHFCLALRARPDVVFETVKKEGLSATARRVFEAAKARCYIEGGWRSEHAPLAPQGYHIIDDNEPY